jgi:hypothetical protein
VYEVNPETRYVVVTLNATAIPLLPLTRDVYMRPDSRYGLRDFAFWTQFYDPRNEHLALIPRRSFFAHGHLKACGHELFGELVPGAYAPNPSDPHKVVMKPSWATAMADCVRQLLGGYLSRQPAADRWSPHLLHRFTELKRFAAFMPHAFYTQALTLPQARRVHRDLQRVLLELMAMCELFFGAYASFAPRCTDELPVRGAFTWDPAVVRKLQDRRAPAFLVRPLRDVSRSQTYLVKIVRCALPLPSRLSIEDVAGAQAVDAAYEDHVTVMRVMAQGAIIKLDGPTAGKPMMPLPPQTRTVPAAVDDLSRRVERLETGQSKRQREEGEACGDCAGSRKRARTGKQAAKESSAKSGELSPPRPSCFES